MFQIPKNTPKSEKFLFPGEYCIYKPQDFKTITSISLQESNSSTFLLITSLEKAEDKRSVNYFLCAYLDRFNLINETNLVLLTKDFIDITQAKHVRIVYFSTKKLNIKHFLDTNNLLSNKITEIKEIKKRFEVTDFVLNSTGRLQMRETRGFDLSTSVSGDGNMSPQQIEYFSLIFRYFMSTKRVNEKFEKIVKVVDVMDDFTKMNESLQNEGIEKDFHNWMKTNVADSK